MAEVVGTGPAFIVDQETNNWSAEASVDLVEVGGALGSTVASLILFLTNVEPTSGLERIHSVGVELTHNDLLYLARDLNQLYDRLVR